MENQPSNTSSSVSYQRTETTSNLAIDVHQFQEYYHLVTGKTDKQKNEYSEPFQLEFQELAQLNIKILQVLRTLGVSRHGCTVWVFHSESETSRFSSFDKFHSYNQNGINPVSRVMLEYNFVKHTQDTDHPQPYKIEIHLVSGVAWMKEVGQKVPYQLFDLIDFVTAAIEITYVDFIIANTVKAAFEEWLKGLPNDTHSKPIKIFKGLRKFYRPGFQLAFFGFISYFIAENSAQIFKYFSVSMPHQQASFLIISIFFMYIFHKAGTQIGMLVEEYATKINHATYIKLNKGDEKLIQTDKIARKRYLINSLLYSIVSLGFGVVANLIADRILK
ncbi:MAG: hypothetical protein RRB13_09935 [bacterium]|nr:hypothetical protein [bacterium]